MTMNKLREIAGGTNPSSQNKDDIYGQAQINKSEAWIKGNESLDSKTKLESWSKEFGDWGFTPNNTEYYWETKEKLSPLSPNKFKEFTISDIRNTIDKLPTMGDKENYFRDNASTWPSYVLDKLDGYFTNIRGANAGQELERNRLSQIMDMKNIMSDKNLALNPNVSVESHAEEIIKAYDMGYTGEIDVDKDGRVSIPLDGKTVPVYTLPNPSLSMEEEFISRKDLSPVVKSRIKPMLKTSRQEQNRTETKTKKALLNRIKTGEIPREFRANVIIDGVIDEKDPAAEARKFLLESIEHNDKKGLYATSKEMFLDYMEQYKELGNTVLRRLNDGRYS